MTRRLLPVAAALALSVLLPVYQSRAVAQQTGEASGQGSGQESADSSGAAETQAATSSGQQSGEQTTATQAPSNATDRNQTTQGAPPLTPPTSAGTDPRQDQSLITQPQGQNQQGAVIGQGTVASVQGRVDVNAQAQVGRENDLQRGIQFDRATNRGLTISSVERNSIFFNSGFRQGDVIVSLDNRPIRSEDDFRRFVAVHPGHRVPVVVLRHGVRETVFIEAPQVVANRPFDNRQFPAGGQVLLGVTFDPQVRDVVIVRSVAPGSPAEQAGLQPGDMIVALNREPVRSSQDAIAIIRSMRPGDRLTIAFERRLQTETEAVLGGQQNEPVHTAYAPDVQSDRQAVPIPTEDRRIIDVDRRDPNSRRGILNRNRDDNRPLRDRLLD